MKSRLKALRTTSHACAVSKYRSRSASVDLTIGSETLEPTFHVKTSPVVWYLTSIWDNLLPRDILMRTWTTAYHNVFAKPRPVIRGPASTAASALKDILWKVIKPFSWERPSGETLDVLSLNPK